MRISAEQRFWSHVDKSELKGCWVWSGTKGRGYGRFYFQGRDIQAHRYIYELHNGPIPENMTIDHLCRNRACVNPDHLEAVTNQDNILRGNGLPANNARKTHCAHGHPYDLFNTRIGKDGARYCKACGK